jgi:hypothetical protein
VEPTKGDFYERPESNESLHLEGSPVLSGRERPKGCLFLPPLRHPLVSLLPRFGAGFEYLLARAGSCREFICRRASPKAPDDASWLGVGGREEPGRVATQRSATALAYTNGVAKAFTDPATCTQHVRRQRQGPATAPDALVKTHGVTTGRNKNPTPHFTEAVSLCSTCWLLQALLA